MARVSRKSCSHMELPECKKNLVGIYTRLSVTYSNKGGKDSIQNQMDLLTEYIQKHKQELDLVKTYSDNGITGTSFERLGWNQMMEDIRAGRIDSILVKDLSRIGRNYIETGTYLEHIFPSLGIRVIAVNEAYDSNDYLNNIWTYSFTNLMNEYYARDISKKTSAAKHTLQSKGYCISGTPPYGYMKTNADRWKLVIDPESGCIVKQIFAWRLDGKGCGTIASYLNLLAVPSPGMYRYLNGNQSFERCRDEKWKPKHVTEILKNQAYLGHMVQGKTKSSYFEQNGKQISVPKEQWKIVEHMHEPLVTQEQFSVAAQMAEQNRKKYQEQRRQNEAIPHIEQPLRNKVFCGQCGYLMTRRNRVKNGERDYYYYCSASQTKLSSRCVGTYIHEIPLLEAVFAEVKQYITNDVITENTLDTFIDKIAVFSYGKIQINSHEKQAK